MYGGFDTIGDMYYDAYLSYDEDTMEALADTVCWITSNYSDPTEVGRLVLEAKAAYDKYTGIE